MNKVSNKLEQAFNQRNRLVVLVVLVVFGTLVYSNTFNAPFQFDDILHIKLQKGTDQLKTLSDPDSWLKIGQKRPLSELSLVLNYKIHQEDLAGYHVVNILVHILASFIVFLLINEILKSPVFRSNRIQENRSLFAFVCALIFLAHPIQTQSVTYIIQRMTSLAGLFYVLSVYLYLKARYSFMAGKQNHYLFYILAAIAGMAALWSKQNAVTFPAAWLLVELFFVRNKENKAYKKYLIVGVSLILLLFLTIVFLGQLPRETEEISRLEYLFTQFRVMVRYMQLSVIPIGQNIDHDVAISTSFFGIKEILSLLVLVGLVILAVFLFKKHRLISFGIFWFFLSISVTSSIIPISDVMFEHRLYLPLLGIILIITNLLFNVMKKHSIRKFAWLMVFIGFVLGGLTFARNETWKSRYSLWKDAAQKSPQKVRTNQNYGISLVEKGDYHEALNVFNKVLKLDPEHTNALFNRINIKLNLKDYKGAIDDLHVFLRRKPEMTQAWDALGKAKLNLKDYNGALKAYNQLLTLDPDFEMGYFNRARVLMYMGEYDRAINDFSRALEVNPANARAHNFIGQIYTYIDQKSDALKHFTKAIQIDPNLAIAYFNRGYLLTGRKDLENGLQDLNKAIQLNPGLMLAYKARGIIHYWNGDYKKAYQDMMHAKRAGVDIPEELLREVEQKIAEEGKED